MGNALTITKNVTVGASYDVIVVGGGPSGSAAAYAVQNNVSLREVPNRIVVPMA